MTTSPQLIAPASAFTLSEADFAFTLSLRGTGGTIHHNLVDLPEFKIYLDNNAHVEFLSTGFAIEVVGTASGDISYDVHACFIPEDYKHGGALSWPKSIDNIRKVPGSISLTRNTFLDPTKRVTLHPLLTPQLQPSVVGFSRPQIVLTWSSQGTQAASGSTPASLAYAIFHGRVKFGGAGFMHYWTD